MLWSPEREEQRYCWSCSKWYTVDCLGPSLDIGQLEYAMKLAARPEFQDVPILIIKAAFQPTARGGTRHFVAGNIRIVSEARTLLEHDFREEKKGSNWMVAHLLEGEKTVVTDDDWGCWLESNFGMNSLTEEILIVDGQSLYACPLCKNNFLI